MDCRVTYFEPTNKILQVRYGNLYLAATVPITSVTPYKTGTHDYEDSNGFGP